MAMKFTEEQLNSFDKSMLIQLKLFMFFHMILKC